MEAKWTCQITEFANKWDYYDTTAEFTEFDNDWEPKEHIKSSNFQLSRTSGIKKIHINWVANGNQIHTLNHALWK